MRKRKRISFLLACAVFAMFFSIPAPEAVAKAKVFNWKVCSGLPYAKGYKQVYQALLDIEKACNGRIKMTHFQPGEHPYSPSDVMKAVRDNTMQMGFTISIYTQSLFPQMAMQELPFMFGGIDEFNAMMKDPKFKDLFDYLLGGPCKEWNQIPVIWWPFGGYCFAGTKWVDDFDSWKGHRIRVYSDVMARMVEVFGATPVFVTWGEVYTALQRKMIDGWVTAVIGGYSAKLYEITKWTTINDFQTGFHWISVNKDTFNKLPKDLQDTFMKACEEQREKIRLSYVRSHEHQTMLSMKEYGEKFKYMNPEFREEARKRMRPIWQDWAKRAGGKAPEMLQRVEEFHSKYIKKQK